jgi:hypothetical protein
MSEPGASQVMNTPLTAEQAGARHAELIRDPDFGKAAAAGDPVKVAELHKLKRIELGLSPEPVPPATADEVRARMTDRQLEADDARLATWEQHIRMNDQMRFQHRRGLATAQQVEDAKRDIERMKRDSAFRQRVLNGDQDAFDRWMRAGRIATMQIVPDDHDWTKP